MIKQYSKTSSRQRTIVKLIVVSRLSSSNKDGIVHYMFSGVTGTLSYKYVLQCLNIAFIIANSADPGEMQHCQTTF